MKQPIHEDELDLNNIELSSCRADKSGIIKTGENLTAGTVLEKDGDKYIKVATAANADAILLEDTNATDADTTAPLLIGGTVDEDMLTLGGALTVDDVRDVLRDKNIYLKKRCN